MSVPCAIGRMPAATAAPAPPDEPPGVMAGSRGFLVSPWIRLVVNQRYEYAGQLVRPRMTAPALRKLSITGLLVAAITSRCSLRPLVVANPFLVLLPVAGPGPPVSRTQAWVAAVSSPTAPARRRPSAGRRLAAAV